MERPALFGVECLAWISRHRLTCFLRDSHLNWLQPPFVTSNEAAWRPALAARSIEWLGTHGYAVLGTELWLPKDGSIQNLPYLQNIHRQGDEAWHSFVARAAAETLAYLRAFTPKFIEEGDVYVNVT